MLNCKNCGAPLSPEEAVCAYCGTPNPQAQESLRKQKALDKALQAYRARQAKITTELTEIVNGAEQAGKM